jgi:hypothetical protein
VNPPTIWAGYADRNTSQPIYTVDAKGNPCNQAGPTQTRVHVSVTDPDTDPGKLKVTITFRTANGVVFTGPLLMTYGGKTFDVTLGPVSTASGASGSVEADVTAVDPAGNRAAPKHLIRLTWLSNCPIPAPA